MKEREENFFERGLSDLFVGFLSFLRECKRGSEIFFNGASFLLAK